MWPTSTFDEVAALQRQVRSFGACSLPGVSIVYDRFMDIMWRAVSRVYVSRQHADFVAKGLWHGFDCGMARCAASGALGRDMTVSIYS